MFGGGFAEQDALDGIRHSVASFFPIDALDESFGAGGLSVVHTAPPGKSYALGQDTQHIYKEKRYLR